MLCGSGLAERKVIERIGKSQKPIKKDEVLVKAAIVRKPSPAETVALTARACPCQPAYQQTLETRKPCPLSRLG